MIALAACSSQPRIVSKDPIPLPEIAMAKMNATEPLPNCARLIRDVNNGPGEDWIVSIHQLCQSDQMVAVGGACAAWADSTMNTLLAVMENQKERTPDAAKVLKDYREKTQQLAWECNDTV